MGSVGEGSELSVDQLLEEYGHICLSIGVPYSIYWHAPQEELTSYIKAYEIRRRREVEDMELALWALGGYIGNSIGSLFDKKIKYPTEPPKIFRAPINELEEERKRKRKEEKEEAELKAFMQMFMGDFKEE